MQLEGKVVTFTESDLQLSEEDLGGTPLVWDFNDPRILEVIDWVIPEECILQNYAVLETDTQILLISMVYSEGVGVYLIEKDE